MQISLKTVLLSLLLLPVLVHAAEDDRWYQVELIIFSQNNPAYRNSEQWPIDYTLPKIEDSRELQRASGKPSASLPEPFTLVPAEKLQLTATAKRIAQASDVELISHLGWVQPGLPEDKAVAVHIHEGDGETDSQARLDGTMRLSLSRYLHLQSDLAWREPLNPAVNVPVEDSRDDGATHAMAQADVMPDFEGPAVTDGAAEAPTYREYRLQQSRRMRSNELHYIDHPLFGIIVVVNRYEP